MFLKTDKKEDVQNYIDDWNECIIARRNKRKELSSLRVEIDSVMARIQWLSNGKYEDQVQKARDKIRHLLKNRNEIEQELEDLDAEVLLKEPSAREAWGFKMKHVI